MHHLIKLEYEFDIVYISLTREVLLHIFLDLFIRWLITSRFVNKSDGRPFFCR